MPSFPTYIIGAKWRTVHDLTIGWFEQAQHLNAGTEFIVAKTSSNYQNLLVKPIIDGVVQRKAKAIQSRGTYVQVELVEESNRIFYGIRRKLDGQIMRDSASPWRWGRVHCYLSQKGVFDRLAESYWSNDLEVVQFSVNENKELSNVEVIEPPAGWRERCKLLREAGGRLGSALLKDEWDVALVFDGEHRFALWEAKLPLSDKIKWPSNLERTYREKQIILFRNRIDAVKHRLALPECEWVSFRG